MVAAISLPAFLYFLNTFLDLIYGITDYFSSTLFDTFEIFPKLTPKGSLGDGSGLQGVPPRGRGLSTRVSGERPMMRD